MPDMRNARARFFARDGKGFGFGAPAAGFSTDFHDPWRMVVGDGEGAHRVSSIMPVCNMQGPTVLSARGPYSRSPRLYELANRYTLSRSLPMAPRLTSAELDYIFELDRAGHRPIEIHTGVESVCGQRSLLEAFLQALLPELLSLLELFLLLEVLELRVQLCQLALELL